MAKKTAKKYLIVGNWKMNPTSPEEAVSLFRRTRAKLLKTKNVEAVLCVPEVFIPLLKVRAKDGRPELGAQNVSAVKGFGAYTGQVSAEMVKKVGAIYTIIGHSEMRAAGDTNDRINEKIKSALEVGLKIILCVGEELRDAHGAYLTVVRDQINIALRKIDRSDFHKIVIAYEPVWAIGDRALRAATPEDILEMQIYIRKVLSDMVGGDIARSMRILYGGSSDQKNCEAILSIGQVDGLLPGRASLNPEVIGEMYLIAEKLATKDAKKK